MGGHGNILPYNALMCSTICYHPGVTLSCERAARRHLCDDNSPTPGNKLNSDYQVSAARVDRHILFDTDSITESNQTWRTLLPTSVGDHGVTIYKDFNNAGNDELSINRTLCHFVIEKCIKLAPRIIKSRKLLRRV